MKLPGRAAMVVGAGAAAGLFVARLLGELVPDNLAIGVSMFGAGTLGGFVLGVLYVDRRSDVARAATLALEKARRLHREHEDE